MGGENSGTTILAFSRDRMPEFTAADDHKLAAGGNVYMTKSGNVTMQVGSVEEIELEEAQKTLGFDLGSAIEEFPSNNEIIKMGRDMLF